MSVRSLNGLSGNTTINVNSFTAGVCLDLSTAVMPVLDFNIDKAISTNTASSNDMFVLQDSNNITKKINYNDLISSSGLGLTAGNALSITNSVIDLDIDKQNGIFNINNDDQFILERTDNSINKITYQNLTSTLNTDITSIKNKYDYASTITDGDLLIGSTASNNFSVNKLTSSGNTVTITNTSNSINLEAVQTDLTTARYIATNTSGSINFGSSSQNLNTVGADSIGIFSGKFFVRSTISSGSALQFQGFNQSSYSNVLEIINVTSGYPYLKLLLSDGFSTNQYTNKNLIVDSSGKIMVDDLPADASLFGTNSTSAVQLGINNQSTFIYADNLICKDKGQTNFRATDNQSSTEYDLIKLNSTSNGDYPYTQLLDSNNLYGSSGQYLGLNNQNKLEWSNVSVSNPIQYVPNTAAVISLTSTSVDGSVAISADPRKLWLKSTVNNNAIWSSIDFIETATSLTSANGLINNTGTTYNFTSSGVGITLPNQNDYFNITIIVTDDYAPDINYPSDTTAFSTTNKAVSSSGSTHTFTAQINNLTSNSSTASYVITISDKNTSTIITLQTISFTFNLSYTAPAFTSTSTTVSSCVSPYTSGDAGNATRYNSLGNIYTDRSYTFYNIDTNAFQNGSTMFNEGKTHYQSGSFFSGLTWNFILSSNVNYLYHFSTSSSTTPSNWTEANSDGTNPVSKGWTNLGAVGNLAGWGNTAYAHRSTDAITAGKYITATRGSQQAFLVAIKDS